MPSTGSAVQPAALHARSRLVRQPRPRRDLQRARPGLLQAGRASTCSRRSLRIPSAPIKEVAAGRADLAISYEPEVLLARGQGPRRRGGRRRSSTQPLTSLISLPEGRDRAPPPTCRARRSAPPASRTRATTSRRSSRPPASPRRRRKEVNVGLNLLPGADRRAGRRDPRRLPEHRGRRPASSAASTRGSCRSTSSASRPMTSSCWSPAARPSTTTRRRSAPSSRPSRGEPTTRSAHPAGGGQRACSRAGKGLDPMQTRAEVARHAAPAGAAARAARMAPGSGAVAGLRRSGWPRTT